MSDHETTETTEQQPQDPNTKSGSTKVGFWRRMFGGKTEPEAEPETATAESTADQDDKTSSRSLTNAPRKRTRTMFDRAEQERRKRYGRAAQLRRERLASAIGDRVEEVIEGHMLDGQRKWAHAAESVNEMNGLLGAIGRNLDEQGDRADRMAKSLEQLPALAEQENAALGKIAERLQSQAQSVEGVPEVVDLVRHGSGIAQQKLAALRCLQDELAMQREQRTQMLDAVRKSAADFQNRMLQVEEAVQKSMLQARTDAAAVRQAIERSSENLTAQAREEALKVSQRARRLEEGLRQVTLTMSEAAALATEQARAQQDDAIGFLHASQDELLAQFQRNQSETVETMERLQSEVREREESLAWRMRTALIGCAGLLAIVGAMITFSPPERPAQAESVRIVRVPVAPAPTPKPAPTAQPKAKAETKVAQAEPQPAATPKRAAPRSLPAGFRAPERKPLSLEEILWGKQKR